MRDIVRVICVIAVLGLTALGADPKSNSASPDDRNTMVIIFKDGHQQTLSMGDVASIEFKTPASATASGSIPSLNHFLGKWEVGQGNGDNFFITLHSDGTALKSFGQKHGTWTLVNGEARISWEDGWHDVIRKVGTKHEKVAYSPGKSFSDEPSNITAARNTQPKPL